MRRIIGGIIELLPRKITRQRRRVGKRFLEIDSEKLKEAK